MSMIKIRFFERSERLGNVEWVFGLFLLSLLIGGFCFWLASLVINDPTTCRRLRVIRVLDVCGPVWLFLMCAIAGTFVLHSFKRIVDLGIDFWRPLQSLPLGRTLRCLLRLKRMRLDQVVMGDSIELHFVTLADNYQPYRAFTLTIKEMHRFNFYQGDRIDSSPDCIFQEGALLEFSYLADSTALDYARAKVRCEYEGQVYHGELELEADNYELKILPRSALEKRQ